jgi:hypothetical protein
LGIKEQETRLSLHEHDDDDDDEHPLLTDELGQHYNFCTYSSRTLLLGLFIRQKDCRRQLQAVQDHPS